MGGLRLDAPGQTRSGLFLIHAEKQKRRSVERLFCSFTPAECRPPSDYSAPSFFLSVLSFFDR